MSVASTGLLSGIGLCLTGTGLFFTAYSMRNTRRSERAKWAAQLALQFFGPALRNVRELLDSEPAVLEEMIATQPPELTEFLNFLELVGYLRNRSLIGHADVQSIFGYYLSKMRAHKALVAYIRDDRNSYEELSRMLNDAKS